jgi:hypothetical protein
VDLESSMPKLSLSRACKAKISSIFELPLVTRKKDFPEATYCIVMCYVETVDSSRIRPFLTECCLG